MDDAELRQQLRAILDLETDEPIDWPRVQRLSGDLADRIWQTSGYEPPHLVQHYLDDVDIRERDKEYGDTQRAEIKRFVETGEREHLESRSASPLPCLVVAGVLAALVIWALS